MAVESSAVQIHIDVIDDNSAATVGKVTQNMTALGAAGATTGQKVKQGMGEVGAGALSSRERVRLLSEEFGVRLPRAMQSMIAQSKVAQTVLSALGTAMIGLGAIQIGVMVTEAAISGVEKLWHNVLDVNAAVKDYNAEVAKAKLEDFGNTHSIETTRLRIDEAKKAVEGYNAAADALKAKADSWQHALDPAAAYMYYQAHLLRNSAIEDQKQLDKLQKERQPSQQHQVNLDQIELQHAGDARLRGEQKITAELEKQHQIIQENARYEAQQDSAYGNPVPTGGSLWDSGKLSTASVEELKANAKAEADTYNLQREHSQELAHMREAALEAGLRGIALYKAQEAAAIDELKYKDMDSIAARKAVHDMFHAEELRRLKEEQQQIEQAQVEAALPGFRGIGKMQAETDIEIGKINGSDQSPDVKNALIAREQSKLRFEMLDAEREYTQQVDALADERATHDLKGFALIQAEAQKAIAEKQRAFGTQYGQINRATPEGEAAYQSGAANLNREKGVIGQGAAQDSDALARRNAQETEQIEAEARVKSLSAERQKTASVEAEYEARTRKYLEELQAQEIGADDYNRRVAAAAAERDAEMVEASKAAREKMAAQFDSFFRGLDHPLQSLKNMGDKVAGEAAAAMVQRIQQHGQHGQGAAAGSTEESLADRLWGRIAGTQHGAASAGVRRGSAPEVAAGSSIKAISLGTAEIHIQSANLAFGGSTAAGSGVSSRTVGSGGTALVAPSGNPVSAGGGTSLTVPGSAWSGGGSTAPESGAPGGFGGGPSGSSTSTPSGGPTWTAPTLEGNGIESMGGAGNGGGAGAVSSFTAGSAGIAPVKKDFVGGAINVAQQGMGLFKQAKGTWGHNSSTAGTGTDAGVAETQTPTASGTLNADGTFSSSDSSSDSGSGGGGTNGGMLGGGGVASNAMAAAGGAIGMYSAYEGNGGVGGALGGAMSGMQLGMALGGPMGAAIGAAAGAIVGAIGFGGREKARVYDLKQVRPRLKNDQDSYQQGGMDYLGAYADIQSLQQEAAKTTMQMGPAADSYYQDTIKKEIKEAEGKLDAQQKAGRSNYTAQAAQYDFGGPVDNFGTLGDGSDHGYARLQRNEFVVEQQAANTHAGALNAINSGATHSDMARYYGADSGTAPAQSQSAGWTGDMHVHAIDAKGVAQFLDKNKHAIRAAVNDSMAENSGAGLA